MATSFWGCNCPGEWAVNLLAAFALELSKAIANQGSLMKRMVYGCILGAVLAAATFASPQEQSIQPDLSHIKDAKAWHVINADVEASLKDGKPVVRMKPKGKSATPSDIGMALLEGFDFAEGTIELDLKGKGKQEASFVGVAFHAIDGSTFESVYFRPFNFLRDPPTFRTHAVQYVCWPEYTWEKLRKSKPGVYESTVKPVPDPAGWFHARIEVDKQKVRVWVDDGKEPCLVVDRLTIRNSGRIGLWVDSKDGSFKSLRILPAK